jgi:hypothetical protein
LDVMADGSLVLLATPGHTEGSISLLIRRGTRPPLLLVGDLTYGAELLERRQVPGRSRPAWSAPKSLPTSDIRPQVGSAGVTDRSLTCTDIGVDDGT